MSLKQLMIHKADVYTRTYSADLAGGSAESFTLKYSQMPCNVQPAPSTTITEYNQRQEDITNSLYFSDPSKTFKIGDRVVFKTFNYRVVGKRDDINMSKVFRIDLDLEKGQGG